MKKQLIIEKINFDDDLKKVIEERNGKSVINFKKLNTLVINKYNYYKNIFIDFNYADIVLHGERYETDEEEKEKRKLIRVLNKKLKNKSLEEIQEIQIK